MTAPPRIATRDGKQGPGAISSVRGLSGAVCVVVAGPFPTLATLDEYVVVPLYPVDTKIVTDDDLCIYASESGLGRDIVAAIWGATPALGRDLDGPIATLSEHAFAAVEDAYWAAHTGAELPMSRRRGRPVPWWRRSKERAFRRDERSRWNQLYGRVWSSATMFSEHLAGRFSAYEFDSSALARYVQSFTSYVIPGLSDEASLRSLRNAIVHGHQTYAPTLARPLASVMNSMSPLATASIRTADIPMLRVDAPVGPSRPDRWRKNRVLAG